MLGTEHQMTTKWSSADTSQVKMIRNKDEEKEALAKTVVRPGDKQEPEEMTASPSKKANQHAVNDPIRTWGRNIAWQNGILFKCQLCSPSSSSLLHSSEVALREHVRVAHGQSAMLYCMKYLSRSQLVAISYHECIICKMLILEVG